MSGTIQGWAISNEYEKFGETLRKGLNKPSMGKRERKQRVLAFLVDARLALPRLTLYRNLRYQGATFSDASLTNYLNELREEGYVERIDAVAFADGKVTASDDDPGYWVVTQEGAEHIESVRSDQLGDINTDHL